MPNVLVVDDSPIDRRLAGGLLQRDGNWQVSFAENGQLALDQLSVAKPDLVVTDLTMPELNGLELVQAIHQQYPEVPVILMTARGSEELAVQALQIGAASYVPKRTLATQLASTARRVLSTARECRDRNVLLSRLVRSEHEFELESDLSLTSALVGYLQQLLALNGICTEAARLRVGIALEEALSNAYYHGNLALDGTLRETDFGGYYALEKQRSADPAFRSRKIRVIARLDHDSAEFIVEDEGAGFDPSGLPDPNDPANLDRASGRGLVLMRTFMDEVRFNSRGNAVTLTKRRAVPAATA